MTKLGRYRYGLLRGLCFMLVSAGCLLQAFGAPSAWPPDSTRRHKENLFERFSGGLKNWLHEQEDKHTEKVQEKKMQTGIRSLEKPPPVGIAPHAVHHWYHNRGSSVLTQEELANEDHWDDLLGGDLKYLPKEKVETRGQDASGKVQIFGFHPYWMGSMYKGYLYNYLSTVAFFSYDVNPKNGSYKSIYSWRNTGLVEEASKAHKKAVLTVTCFGLDQNEQLLGNPRAQQTLIDSVISLVTAKGAHGVCVDFEKVPYKEKERFNDFLMNFSRQLKAKNKDFQFSMTVPAIDVQGLYNIIQLRNHVDFFIVMAYDYNPVNARTAGPNAPLRGSKQWGPYSIDYSVESYLHMGMPAKKMLLGVAYYGTQWKTKGKAVPSDNKGFLGSMTFAQIKEEQGYPLLFDTASNSEYYSYPDDFEEGKYNQIWFDGSRSLDLKYKYVLDKGLGGVAIWTLGYDHEHTDLWDALVDNFSEAAVSETWKDVDSATHGKEKNRIAILGLDTMEIDTFNEAQWVVNDFLHDVKEYGVRSIVLVVLIILSGFFLLGFLIAFTNYNLAMLFSERLIVVYFTIGVILAVTTYLLTVTSDIIIDWVMFAFGVGIAVTGTTLLYLITRKKKKRLNAMTGKTGNSFLDIPLKSYRAPKIPQAPRIRMNFVKQEPSFLQKLKKLDKLVSWIIVALVVAVPITFFTHILLYLVHPSFVVYSLSFEVQQVWFVVLYITCFIGFFLCRLGVWLCNFLKDQSYF